jgi:5-methylcytosine-specific restriction endonuclease McrA
VQQPLLSSSQKNEILRRQAFKCIQCQTDLEPVGREPPHFELITPLAAGGASGTTNFRALCPACHAMKSSAHPEKASEEKKRRQRDSGPARSAKKFVKSGFDTRKF